MFRVVLSGLNNVSRTIIRQNVKKAVPAAVVSSVKNYSSVQELDDEFDERYVDYFNREDIDGWEMRQAMNDIQAFDMVPHPNIINAALRACRRVNDFSASVRFLESVQYKCGNKKDEFWPYIQKEIQPALDELGLNTPEQLGYDKPELALKDVYEM